MVFPGTRDRSSPRDLGTLVVCLSVPPIAGPLLTLRESVPASSAPASIHTPGLMVTITSLELVRVPLSDGNTLPREENSPKDMLLLAKVPRSLETPTRSPAVGTLLSETSENNPKPTLPLTSAHKRAPKIDHLVGRYPLVEVKGPPRFPPLHYIRGQCGPLPIAMSEALIPLSLLLCRSSLIIISSVPENLQS